MVQRDYYWEYLQTVDKLLYEFITEVKAQCFCAFFVNGISIEKGIINWLWDQMMYQKSRRQWYNTERLKGASQTTVYNQLKKWLYHTFADTSIDYQNIPLNYSENEEIETLKSYAHQINILCRNKREWEYWKPLLRYSKEKMIIWCNFALQDDEEFSGRELNNEELIQIRGGAEMNSHYSCTFRKNNEDEGTDYNYYASSSEAASNECLKDHESECDHPQKLGCQCACG